MRNSPFDLISVLLESWPPVQRYFSWCCWRIFRYVASSLALVYIEYFYLIMYGAILLFALNADIFSLGREDRWAFLHYQDNLIPKILFWPLLLWVAAITTWVKL